VEISLEKMERDLMGGKRNHFLNLSQAPSTKASRIYGKILSKEGG